MSFILVDRGPDHNTYEIHNSDSQFGMPYQVAWINKTYCTLTSSLGGRSSVEIDGDSISLANGMLAIPIQKRRTVDDVKEELVKEAVKYAFNCNTVPSNTFFDLAAELRDLQAKEAR